MGLLSSLTFQRSCSLCADLRVSFDGLRCHASRAASPLLVSHSEVCPRSGRQAEAVQARSPMAKTNLKVCVRCDAGRQAINRNSLWDTDFVLLQGNGKSGSSRRRLAGGVGFPINFETSHCEPNTSRRVRRLSMKSVQSARNQGVRSHRRRCGKEGSQGP